MKPLRQRGLGASVFYCAFALLLAAGCATSYKARGAMGDGYFEEKLSPNQWIVSFDASRFTPREEIDKYLFFRCAEVALYNGSRFFSVIKYPSGTRVKPFSPSLIDYPPWDRPPGIGAEPERRDEAGVSSARVVIQTHGAEKPEGEEGVYDAREVIKQLASRMRPL